LPADGADIALAEPESGGVRAEGFNEAVRRRIGRVAGTVDVETADDLWIKNKVASDRVHVPTTLFVVCIIGPRWIQGLTWIKRRV
jgi:hypothetical protein